MSCKRAGWPCFAICNACRTPQRFRPWAFRIVRNKAADLVRQCIQERKWIARQTFEAPGEPAHPREDMRDLLGTLPEQYVSLLALHYLEGVTCEEMAAIPEVPTGTIKSRLHAALGGKTGEAAA